MYSEPKMLLLLHGQLLWAIDHSADHACFVHKHGLQLARKELLAKHRCMQIALQGSCIWHALFGMIRCALLAILTGSTPMLMLCVFTLRLGKLCQEFLALSYQLTNMPTLDATIMEQSVDKSIVHDCFLECAMMSRYCPFMMQLM